MRKRTERRNRAGALSVMLSAALAISGLSTAGIQTVQAAKEEVSQQNEEVDAVTDSGSFGGEKDSTGAQLTPDTHQWSFAAGSGVLTISGEGAMPDYTSSTCQSTPWYAYKSEIKKIVFAGKVTAVGAFAFYDYRIVEQVDFSGAKELTEVGESAFYYTLGLNGLAGAEGITTLGKNAFKNSGLKTVSMPGVSVLPEGVFRQCKSLVSIDFPNATMFGKDAFYQCEVLTDVAAPKVETLADNAFQKCYALERIELPELLTISNGYVFFECKKLRSVSFPKLSSITGQAVFRNCVCLERIDFPLVTQMKNVGVFFQGCTSLVSVNLPKAEIEQSVMNNMFDGCASLVWADLSSVTSINQSSMFKGTNNLRRLYIGGGKLTTKVTTTFYNGVATKQSKVSIYILESSQDNFSAVYGAKELVAVSDLEAVKAKEMELHLSQEDYDIETPAEPKVTGKAEGAELTYRYCTDLACQTPIDSGNPSNKPTVPGVYYVQAVAGAVGEDYFDTVSNPIQFTVYGEKEGSGFSYHNKTHVLTIKDAAVMDADYADRNSTPWKDYYSEVEKIVVAEGVTLTRIGDNAFNYMQKMVSFDLPDTVTSIGKNAFYYCTAWKAEDVLTDKVVSVGENAFYACGSISGRMVFNDSITEIPAGVLRSCSQITKIQYSDHVTSFGTYCFYNTGVTELMVPSGMTELPEGFYEKCKNVTKVVLPEGTTKIPDRFFSGCTSLREFDIPETVTEIGATAFYGSGVTSIVLPDSVTTIGRNAFGYTQDLETIEISSGVTALPEQLLYYSGVRKVIVPSTVSSVGKDAFQRCERLEYLEFQRDDYTADTFTASPGSMNGESYDSTFLGVPQTAVIICSGGTYTFLAGLGTKKMATVSGFAGWLAEEILYDRDAFLAKLEADYSASKAETGKLTEADYDKELWGAFQAALSEADILFAQGDTVYDKITNRKAAVRSILDATKLFLRATYQETQDVLEADYDTDGDGADAWFDYLDQRDKALELLQSEDVTITEVIEGEKQLRSALGEIVLLPIDGPKAEVDQIIQEAEALKEADYTPESWAVLQAAIREAQEICKDATKISQVAVAKKKMNDAMGNLVKVDAADPGTNPSASPSANPSADPSVSPSTNPSANPSANPSIAPSAAPSTSPTKDPGVQPTKGPGGSQIGIKPSGTANPQKISVKKVTLKKVKSAKKKTITVQWKRDDGVTGYQVQISLNKKFKKGKKTYTVKKAKVTKKIIKKLKSKKKYYVRVRAYKTVKTKRYYGKWSSMKKVKVK